jgi:DNA polymerase-1
MISFDTKFYSPLLKSYIFPIDPFHQWFKMDNWKRYFVKHQIKKILEFKPHKSREKKLSYEVITDLDKFYKEHGEDNRVAIDTESSGLDSFNDILGYVSFAFDTNTGYCMKWEDVDPIKFGKFIKEKFQIWMHGKHDIKFFLNNGIPRECLHVDYDIWNAGHILNEMRSNSLSAQSWHYTKMGGYDKPLKDYKKKYQGNNYLLFDPDLLIEYSAYDAVATYTIFEKTIQHIQWIDEHFPTGTEWSLERYYNDIIIPSTNMYIDIEYKGTYVDKDILIEEGNIINDKIEKLKKEIYKEFDVSENELDLESPLSIGRFFEKRELPPYARGKSNQLLTGDEYLQKWIKAGYREAEYILEYRQLATLKKTFLGDKKGRGRKKKGYWKCIKEHDNGSNRFHSTFSVMLKKSHRNGCEDPNLQQVPVHDETAKIVRKIFIPPSKEYGFLSADFAGLQLRLIASQLEEGSMLRKVFLEMNGDMHSMTAVSVLLNHSINLKEFMDNKKDPDKSKARFKAKQVNFSSAFGAGAGKIMQLAIEPFWSEEDCRDYIEKNRLQILEYKEMPNIYYTAAFDIREKYFVLYSGLNKWIEQTKMNASKRGYVRSVYGAIRRLPQLLYQGEDDNKAITANLLNIALNSPIQGMEIVVVHRVMLELDRFLKKNNMKTRFFAQIHDAIELYSTYDEKELVWEKIQEYASKIYPEYRGILLEIEGNFADYYNKNQLWDFGEELF